MQQRDIIRINKRPIVEVTCVWEANLDDPRNGLGREHDPGAALSAFFGVLVQLGEGRGDKKKKRSNATDLFKFKRINMLIKSTRIDLMKSILKQWTKMKKARLSKYDIF